MCFSAEASFFAAGLTGAAGLVALSLTERREQWPLAAMPLFFAAQQTVEGLLWQELALSAESYDVVLWTRVFLMFALVFWPVYAPLAVVLVEPDRRRRQWMGLLVLCGVAVSIYFLTSLIETPRVAAIGGAYIVYSSDPDLPVPMLLFYPLATCGAAALSSHRLVRLLSAVLITGGFVAYYAYWHAFTSVWCFFAAVASVVIVFQFEMVRRQQESETLSR